MPDPRVKAATPSELRYFPLYSWDVLGERPRRNWPVLACDGLANRLDCSIRWTSSVRKLQAPTDATLFASPNEAGCCATGWARLPRKTFVSSYAFTWQDMCKMRHCASAAKVPSCFTRYKRRTGRPGREAGTST